MTPVVAPVRTHTQRMDALSYANEIRILRASLKRNLKDGSASVLRVLTDPAQEFHSMKLRALLLALPKWGPTKAGAAMRVCSIAYPKTVGGLSDRQRADLSVYLTERGIK